MTKLEVKENKKLVLKHVLKKEIRNMEMEKLEIEIQNFTKKIELLKVKARGPLIIKNYGTTITDDGNLLASYDLMVQVDDYKQYGKLFGIEETHACPYCVYVRFEGKPEDLHYAYSKLDVYFYENELEATGVEYSLYLEENENYSKIDIFRQVVTL